MKPKAIKLQSADNSNRMSLLATSISALPPVDQTRQPQRTSQKQWQAPTLTTNKRCHVCGMKMKQRGDDWLCSMCGIELK